MMNTQPDKSLPDLEQLKTLVMAAAHQHLLPRFGQTTRYFKGDGSIVTQADHAIQGALITALNKQWPKIPVLGEEMSSKQQQKLLDESRDGLWILDPLDGTSNFASGIPCFAVSLALLCDGKIRLGIIYDPLRKECFSAIHGQGAWLNDDPLHPVNTTLPLEKCMAQIDFKRLPTTLAVRLVSEMPYSSQRSFGSGVLDWCWLAMGRVQLYLHGQQKLWDIAAGQLILTEAGGHAMTLEGEAVFRSSLEPRSIVAAAGREQFEAWRSTIVDSSEYGR